MAPSSTTMRSRARRRSSVSAADRGKEVIAGTPIRRHARACRGHPRLQGDPRSKAWMAGTSPAMTWRSWRSPSCRALHRPHAEEVTDGEHEIGAIHRVEVKVGDAAIDEVHHLL